MKSVQESRWFAARGRPFIRAFTFPPHPAAKTCPAGRELEIRPPVAIGPICRAVFPAKWNPGRMER
jgi:hypothetical protein